MTSFKGTKGTWVQYDQDPTIETATLYGLAGHASGDHEVFLAYGRTPEKAKANALLISKAPEILEMLESVVDMFGKGQFLTEEKVIKKRTEIEQLIKEATTI